MTKSTTHTIKMAIPSNEEMDGLYELMNMSDALGRFQPRDSTPLLAESLEHSRDDLSDEEYAFLMKAWGVLVDGGGLGRLLCAYSSWHATCQHPGVDYVEFNAKFRNMAEAADLTDVYREAYEEAQARLNFLCEAFVVMKAPKDAIDEITK